MGHFVLVTEHPQGRELRFELQPQRAYRIGSMGDNDIVLPQPDVSRHHAILRVNTGGFHVTDLNSKNGTFVNGQRVATAEFHCGDQLMLSSAAMVLMELSSGSFVAEGVDDPAAVPRAEADPRDDTRTHRDEISIEDAVAMLEELQAVARSGNVTRLLARFVDRLALGGIAVLYRDAHRQLALTASAGGIQELVTGEPRLLRLVQELSSDANAASVRELREGDGLHLLVTPMPEGYVLALRVCEIAPSVMEVRAIRAAVTTALGAAGRVGPRAIGRGGAGSPPTPEELAKLPLDAALERVERWRIGLALDAAAGNRTVAARELGLSRGGLFKKMRRFDLDGGQEE